MAAVSCLLMSRCVGKKKKVTKLNPNAQGKGMRKAQRGLVCLIIATQKANTETQRD